MTFWSDSPGAILFWFFHVFRPKNANMKVPGDPYKKMTLIKVVDNLTNIKLLFKWLFDQTPQGTIIFWFFHVFKPKNANMKVPGDPYKKMTLIKVVDNLKILNFCLNDFLIRLPGRHFILSFTHF